MGTTLARFGANQALAAARLQGDVSFIGACGQDPFGEKILSSLKEGGVNTKGVFQVQESTGVASITVEKDDENRILIIPGANKQLTRDRIAQWSRPIKEAEILLLQLEIPLETVLYAIELAHESKTKVILDPAPGQRLPEDIYAKIHYLLPNEGELALLLKDYPLESSQEKVDQLFLWGVKGVLVTRGSKGISFYTPKKREDYRVVKVEPVDTTAAGDSFAGAFVTYLQKYEVVQKAILFANHAAALSVTSLGAQSSLPYLWNLKEFMKKEGVRLV